MRMIFPLPPLLVAGATLGGLFAPFAVGSVPTDSIGIAAATERQFGADVPVCHGSASAGVTRVMLRLAQIRTEVPQAEMQAASPAAAFADTDPPLWEGLGGVTYRITTANELAQSYFNQGLRLTYAFNHSEAQRAFRKAQKLDPDCAMCFWGEALVLGPNINLPMQEDAVAPAFAAAEKARMLAPKATPREQALIAAVSTRYAKDAKADRAPLDAAYASAMEKVAAQFPDDNEIAVLYAESVMDLSPWNYWQPGGQVPNQQSGSHRADARTRAGARPEPSGCDPLLHPRGGGVGPAGARRALCGPAAGGHSRRRPPRAHAEPHLLPGRALSRRAGRQQDGDRGGREISGGDQCAHGRVSPRVLPAQRPFRAGVCPDGGRRTHRHRGGREAARPHPRRGRARHRAGAAGQGGALLRACAVQPFRYRSGAPRSRATPFRTSRRCGTTRAALPTRRRAILPPPRRRRMRSRPSRAGISRCSNPRAFRHRTCWRWRALSSKPASRSVRATRLQRSSGSSGRLRCRTGCPTWSRPTGITRCGSRSQSR